MKLWGDYHTHTIYSHRKGTLGHHAKGTLEENVAQAAKLGLKEIAITDHGFNHKLFCTYRKNLDFLKAECNRLSQKYKINVLLGVEANIISERGDIDVLPEDYKKLDIVLVGYHKLVKALKVKDQWSFLLPNFLFKSKKRTQRNTEAFINAIEKNKIDVITHLKQDIWVDCVKIAKAAAKKGTIIELNNKHFHLTDDEFISVAKTGVKFIIDSDAHKPQCIGQCENVLEKIQRLNIPTEQVINLDRLPEFLNYKRKRG